MSEAKHILEWYEELPEPYRSAAIANYDEERVAMYSDLCDDGNVKSLVEAIFWGFSWLNKDIPGLLCWHDLHRQLKQGIFSLYPQIKTTFLEGIEF